MLMEKNKKQRIAEKRIKIRNKKLVKKYPWIIPRNVWTGKIPKDYDYSYTVWELPRGWHKAFGQMYLEELGAAVKEAGLENDFMIYQIKEKYGSLRVYTNGVTENIHRIIDKYEHLSEDICIGCGKPDVPMINDGWYSPWCYECFKKNWRNREKYVAERRHKLGEKFFPATDEEIKQAYDECIACNDENMPNSYTVHQYINGETTTTTYDISETAQVIRKRWRKRYKNKENG